MELTENQKFILRKLSKYIQSYGIKRAEVTIEYDFYGSLDDYFRDRIGFSNNWSVPFPEFASSTLYDIVKHLSKTDALDSLDIDSLNYDNLNINIHADTQMIEITRDYGYNDEGDTSGLTWGDDTDDTELVTRLLDSVRASKLSSDDIIRLNYYGGGDSGYLEGAFEGGGRVPSDVEDWCYGRLEDNFGGWEINEGSQGYFTFDLDKEIIELEHTYNEDVNESNEILFKSFGKSS